MFIRKKTAFRVDETQLYFVFGFLLGSDRLGSAGLGWAGLGSASCLPPKVGVSRRRDGNLSKKVVSRVDETMLAFGSVRLAWTRGDVFRELSVNIRFAYTRHDFVCARVGSAGLGLCGCGSTLPPKVVVLRRRDSIFSNKVASRVDETTLDFKSVRLA